VSKVEEKGTAGFGHAYGFVVKRLFRERRIPIIPVLLNTYYPPNVPSARRVLAMGRALADALKAAPQDLRVAVVASGGLSHFVVDEELDRRILGAFAEGDFETLAATPREALNSGSSEILNWIMTAGVMGKNRLAWQTYEPLYRTPAGTGVGAAFVLWKPTESDVSHQDNEAAELKQPKESTASHATK
jgi:Catalytic LigB subunit of aromatic ring-opening dioxygenase